MGEEWEGEKTDYDGFAGIGKIEDSQRTITVFPTITEPNSSTLLAKIQRRDGRTTKDTNTLLSPRSPPSP